MTILCCTLILPKFVSVMSSSWFCFVYILGSFPWVMAVTICKYQAQQTKSQVFSQELICMPIIPLNRAIRYLIFQSAVHCSFCCPFVFDFVCCFGQRSCDEDNKLPLLKALTTSLAESNQLNIATTEQLDLNLFLLSLIVCIILPSSLLTRY